MFPIGNLIRIGMIMHSISVEINDYEYSIVDGEDIRSFSATRTIIGAVDPSNSKLMDRIFGGSASAGDIMIITNETLYIQDAFADGETKKQSFATYQGTIFRVSNSADWTPQAGMMVYLCKRHLSQDSL